GTPSPTPTETKRFTAAHCASESAATLGSTSAEKRPASRSMWSACTGRYGRGAREERLGNPAVGCVHQLGRFVAAVIIGIALRPDHAKGGYWLTVDEVLLVLLMPAKNGRGGAVGAAVLMPGADVVPPGLDAAGDAFDHPHARLVGRLDNQP